MSLLKHVNDKIMKSNYYFIPLILICCILCLNTGCNTPASDHSNISAGVAKVNITPGEAIPMSGYRSRTEPFDGIHDSIYARAVVFSDGTNKAAVISSEIIGFSNAFWEETTQLIEQKTGIEAKSILLTAVHNHSGPVTRVYTRDESPAVVSYVETLQNKIVQLVFRAAGNLQPARIGTGSGECLMNINRRANDGNGNIQLGRNPYGPCDHEVKVMRIDDLNGDILSTLVDWPCHGVVMGPRNRLISGDWPGHTSRYIEDSLDIIAPIIVGASGDINPIYGPHMDFLDVNSYAFALDAIGYDLGNEAIRISNEITTASAGEISSLQKIISLPGKDDEHNRLHHANYEPGKNVEVRLTVIRIGDIILAGINGEVFNQIGVKVREQSPFPKTFIITHCNGSTGYFVTDAAIPEGGYEVRSTSAASGAEEGIVSGLLGMIKELGE